MEMILLTLFQDESSVNLFAGGEQEISSTDPDLLKWIQKRIENLMKYKQRWTSREPYFGTSSEPYSRIVQ